MIKFKIIITYKEQKILTESLYDNYFQSSPYTLIPANNVMTLTLMEKIKF